jgi:hypothetical protein
MVVVVPVTAKLPVTVTSDAVNLISFVPASIV